ncbi:Rab3 GTPase-activating protein non-catalytic subunit, partial [Paragonimus westermani]
SVCDLLSWDLEDADRCLKLYTFAGSILRPSSHLQLTRPMELHAFVDCFTYRTDLSVDRTSLNNSFQQAESRWPLVFIELRADDPSNQLAKIGSLVFSPYVLGHQLFVDLKKQLEMGVLSPELLLRALTSFLLYWETYQALPTLIRRLHRIYTYLFGCFISASRSTKSYVEPQNSSVLQLERLLSQLYSYCLDGAHFSSTYLVSLIIRCIVYTMWQSLEHGMDLVLALWSGSQENLPTSVNSAKGLLVTKETTTPFTLPVSEKMGSCNTWYSSTLQLRTNSLQRTDISSASLYKLIDQWHDTCTRLEDLLGLGLMVQVRASEAFSNGSMESLARNVFPITLRRVLCLGRACLTELFASWLVYWQVEPNQLITLYQSLCTLPKSSDTACASKQTLVAEQPEASTELVGVSSVGLIQASSTSCSVAIDDCFACSRLRPNLAALKICQRYSFKTFVKSERRLRLAEFRTLFPLVYRRLPFTLELDTVIASVCWMHYQRWLSDPEAIRHFQKCIEYLRRLSSAGAMISQGLATIMWQGRLRFWYGQCVNAVCGSNAELPGNRLGNEQLKHISILLMNFMGVYAKACEKADVVPVFSVEREWSETVTANQQSRSTSDELSDMQMESELKKDQAPINLSRTLISEAAVNQLAPDHRSVLSWEQVLIVVAALHAFGRPVMLQRREQSSLGPKNRYEPINFFVPEDSDAITKSFSPNWISASFDQQVRSSLDSCRRFFLAWLIERAVLTYRTTSAPDLVKFRHSSSLDSWRTYEPLDVYRLFTSAAVTLCRHWGYPKDVAISQHVLSLFEATLDDQAELYLSQVENLANLATGLLVVVGRRVAWLCFGYNSPNQLRWRSCIPFELESWLRGLLPDPSDEFSLEVSCDRKLSYMDPTHLAHLIEFVLQNVPSYASQNVVAESLRDVINSMID